MLSLFFAAQLLTLLSILAQIFDAVWRSLARSKRLAPNKKVATPLYVRRQQPAAHDQSPANRV